MRPAVIAKAHVDDEHIAFTLTDGRVIAAPTAWSRRLTTATSEQHAEYVIGGSGTHVEWPAIDEHVELWTLLGVPEDGVLAAAETEEGSRDRGRTAGPTARAPAADRGGRGGTSEAAPRRKGTSAAGESVVVFVRRRSGGRRRSIGALKSGRGLAR
jgi:hypothetical protein